MLAKKKTAVAKNVSVAKKMVALPKVDSQYKSFMIKLVLITIFLIVLLFLYQIKNTIIILFFSLFLNILFSPLLNKFNKWKIPDIFGIIIIYILVIIFILTALFAIIPIFIKQFGHLATMIQAWIEGLIVTYSNAGIDGMNIPDFLKDILKELDISSVLQAIQTNAGEITKFVGERAKNIFSSGFGFISSITSSIFSLGLVIIFTFFIALERHNIRKFFYDILPVSWRNYFLGKEPTIVNSLKDWFKTQGVLAICIFSMTLIGLNILPLFGTNLEGKFTLALIAGMMEFVPYIGPILSAIPALVIALGLSYKAAIAVLILYIIIQQLENNVLVPYVMGKSLSLSPFAVLIGMTIGASIFGIIGIIIAVPVVAVVQIFVKDYIDRNRKK